MKKVMIIGDLHISDAYTGKHKDYFQNCINFLNKVTAQLVKQKIDILIITGDLIGVKSTERTFRSRDALIYFIKVMQYWNKICEKVVCIEGNHDISDKLGDYGFCKSLGLFECPAYLDVGCTRFHFISYGRIRDKIEFDETKYNIAVTHDNILIDGKTNWFFAGEGYELSDLHNLYGVEAVIAGHIHNPSPDLNLETSIKDKPIMLIYPGCGTRPKKERDIWNMVWGITFEIDDVNVNMGAIKFELPPADEIFAETIDEYEIDEEELGEYNVEELTRILDELNQFNIDGSKDIKSQIRRYAGIDKEACELAISYLDKAGYESKS